MKKLLSVLLSLLMLVGCSSSNIDFEGELYLFLPGAYISNDVIKQFEKEYKIKVNVDNFESNEDMYTLLLSGDVYDVIIPSDYMIERLIEEDMVQPINKDIVTNLDKLYEGVLNQDYDPDNTYSVPYFWGDVGIVYDETKVDSQDVINQGWEVLRNPKYAGILYMYDSSRDSFMIPLKQLGYSMNTTNEDEINQAEAWLKEQKNTMKVSYVTDEAIDGLAYATEGKYLGVMYSGDAAYILSENENARFYAPEIGTNFWVDAMVIHKDANNVENANLFINFIIDYEAQLANSSEVGYCSVNAEALAELTGEGGEFEDNEAYLPRERNANDEVFHNNEKTRKILSEKWKHIVAK